MRNHVIAGLRRPSYFMNINTTKGAIPMKWLLSTMLVAFVAPVVLAQNWTSQTSGTTNPLQAVWFTDAQNGWVVGDFGTSRFTTDGGQTWNGVTLTGQDLEDVAFVNQSTGLIVGDNGLIFRTITGGVSWTIATSGTSVNLRTVTFGDGGVAYVGGRDGVILRSMDLGVSWTLAEAGSVRYRSSSARGTQRAWIVGDGGVIRATTNAGASWFTQSSGTGSDLHGVFFLNENEGWIGGQNNMLLYTSNGGSNWFLRNTGINVGIDAVYFLNSNEGWAVGNFGAIFGTTNGGVSWFTEPSGTANELNDVFFADGHGWAVGDVGTILHRSPATSVGENPEGLPVNITLLQNYPNPFNPSTRISFTIPHSSHVIVRVYDLLGREVATLVNEPIKPGTYDITWNAEGMPSGVYLYRMSVSPSARRDLVPTSRDGQTAGFTETKRMLLVK